ARSTRYPSIESETRSSAPCFPWPVVFPPHPPPTAFRLCSGTSQVLHDRTTLHQRSCWTCGSSPSPTGPLTPSSGVGRASRISRVEFPYMRGSLTSQSPMNARLFASTDVAFRHHGRRRHSDFLTCRGSIPRLHVLLSTLRFQPCDRKRMTRSRCGSLGLHRMALSSTPPRRFIPAHPRLLIQTPFTGSGMPIHVCGVLVHTISDFELSRVRTELE